MTVGRRYSELRGNVIIHYTSLIFPSRLFVSLAPPFQGRCAPGRGKWKIDILLTGSGLAQVAKNFFIIFRQARRARNNPPAKLSDEDTILSIILK